MGETPLVVPPGPRPSAAPVVRVAGLKKRYGKQVAVREVDLEVRAGEIYGLIGPDGSGKSSVMKSVAGVLAFDAGDVDVLGVRLDSERAAERIKSRIGFMPQGLGLNLYPELSVEENIDFFARLRLVSEKDLAQRKARLLAVTRLAKFLDRPMRQLSGGMKQKLGLICTLIHEPELLILDEPTTGVDPLSRRDFWAILAGLLRTRRITVLVSTAYMDEASRFHRASLLFDGRVVACGEPESVLRQVPGSIVTLKAEPQIEAFDRLRRRFGQVEASGPWLRVFAESATPAAAADQVEEALEGVRTRDVSVAEPELEDVFVALLGRKRLAADEGEVRVEPGAAPARPAPPAGFAIEATGLSRDFGAFRAVDGVTFRVPHGEIFGLLGANGAGKTTVIKMLTGILPPSAGEGRVAGADMHRAGQAIKERIGYMSQAFSLYPDLTVIENIRLYASIYGLARTHTRARVDWVLGMAGLTGHETQLAGGLPVGLRQRLALGCALVHRPQVLFLDEPTSGVDPIGRRRFWRVLFRLSREDGVAILMTTHHMREAEHCDHLALMYAGRVVADASPAEMRRQLEAEAGTVLEVGTDRPLEALRLLEAAGFGGAALFGTRIRLLALDPAGAEQRVRAVLRDGGVALRRATERPLTMEDVFVSRILDLEQREREAR